MCYFLCLCVPHAHANVPAMFDAPIRVEPISEPPLAHAALGPHGGTAYLLTANGCSCDLLYGGHRMGSMAPAVLDGIGRLLQHVPRVTLLSHWYTQPLGEVAVEAAREQTVTLARLQKIFPAIEEDTRYVVGP